VVKWTVERVWRWRCLDAEAMGWKEAMGGSERDKAEQECGTSGSANCVGRAVGAIAQVVEGR
jgi:hypothetical protein